MIKNKNMKLIKTYNKGMFALIQLHEYASSSISKDKYNMNLFKNCDLKNLQVLKEVF